MQLFEYLVIHQYLPVVERSGALRELEMQQVDLFEHPFGVIQRVAAALRECAQPVPLRADALASRVHARDLMVLQSAVIDIIYYTSAFFWCVTEFMTPRRLSWVSGCCLTRPITQRGLPSKTSHLPGSLWKEPFGGVIHYRIIDFKSVCFHSYISITHLSS